MDQTGNLRSSVGYAILNQGKVVFSSRFEKVKAESTEGNSKSQRLIEELRKKYNQGFVLCCCRNGYAVYVEALGECSFIF